MVHRAVFYNISHNAIPRSGGFVTRKATIAALAVLAMAAGAMLPRTFETAPPAAAQAQTRRRRSADRAGHRRHRRRAGRAGRARGDRHGAAVEHGHDQEPGRRSDRRRPISRKARTSRPERSLFQIDPRPFEAALAQAEATKQKDEASLASAQSDLARAAQLSTQGYKSQQAYDQAKALVGQLQASIKSDEAQIETAKLNLSYATIKAPIDGRLGARLVDAGNMVRASEAARARDDRADPADRRRFHGAAGEPAQGSREAGAGAAGRAGDRRGRQDAALDRQADADRQPDRSDDRHAEAEGELRQRGRAAVAGPVRQCAADRQHAPRRSDRAGADRAGRAERFLCLCHQGRQHRRAAPRRGRRGAGRRRRHHQRADAGRESRRRWAIPPDERVAGAARTDETDANPKRPDDAAAAPCARASNLPAWGQGDEHFRTVHSSADRDIAADARHPGIRDRRLSICCRSRRCRAWISRRSWSAPAIPAPARRRWPRRSRPRSNRNSPRSPASPR